MIAGYFLRMRRADEDGGGSGGGDGEGGAE